MHERVVCLNDHFLSYYRKKPKNFEKNNLQSLGDKAKPKMSVVLAKVTDIDVIQAEDMKKFSKLKKPDMKKHFIKLTFLIDGGLVKGQPSELDKDSDAEDEKDDANAKEKSWYFYCESYLERNQYMS